MNKHTKGPWNQSGTTVYALNENGVNRFHAQVQDAHTSPVELIANARLIAAAPELLESLERLIKLRDDGLSNDYYLFKDAIDAARAVANKARGEA